MPLANVTIERIREVLTRMRGASAEDACDAVVEAERDIVLAVEDELKQRERDSAEAVGGAPRDWP